MKDFFLDIWTDLREKRLWPVALILGLAFIAVPIFLLDSSSAEQSAVTPPVASPQGGSTAASAVSLQETASRPSSRLDIFGKNDPFRRPIKRAPAESSSATSVTGGPATGGGLASSSAGGDGLGGSSGIFAADSATGAALAGGSLPGGSGGSSSGGSSGGSSPSSSPPAGSSLPGTPKDPTSSSTPGTSSPGGSTPLKAYAYRLDLRFGTSDQVSTLKDVKRLTPLPSDRRPYVVFLGVEEDGKTAVFLVNTDKVTPSGSEGECKPTPTDCSLLYLQDTPDADQHTFLDQDGNRYGLTLTDIHMDAIGTTTNGAEAKSAKGRNATAAKDDKPTKTERRNGFSFPDFFDLFRGRR